MFDFDLKSGHLQVGEKKYIKWVFKSSIPGEFKETFRWKLEGSNELLSVLFIGHVIAPVFTIDQDQIDLGKVSYTFPKEHKFKIHNSSTVPFTYNLRIPSDSKSISKEFDIEPARDEIKAKETKIIKLTFVPKAKKKYEMVLVVDIEGVGQDMQSIPIRAECEVPQVEIRTDGESADKLDFKNVFLRHPETQSIKIINLSKHKELLAKFNVLPQNEDTKILAKYQVDPSTGTIEAGGTATVTITMTTQKLGDISMPLAIEIVGQNNEQPHILNIVANSIGPQVEVGQKEIDFNVVDVLSEEKKTLTITNKSKIPADFHAFTKNKNSIFKPLQKRGELKPDEQMTIDIICCPDEATKFQDILHFVIKEGLDVDVVLKARGQGSTLFCKEKLDYISFDTQFTYRTITREIMVENKGRKQQKLTWVPKKTEKKKTDEPQKKPNNQQNPQQPGEEVLSVFNIIPNEIILPPKHGIMFQFKANSQKKGNVKFYKIQAKSERNSC